jgi:glycosyltransferase involved in cell wall biosynthesis
MDSVPVEFSIITPSLNMLGYLKRCCASVADQEGVISEHIVMDGGSTDGTVAWLGQNERVAGIVQQDNSMYDAINKGLLLSKGQVLSYLNCDEQYLPGALAFVKTYFERHPEVDIVFGDALLIRPDGTPIAYRKGYRPRWYYVLSSHLYVLSCTMFMRRKIIDAGFRFDDRFKVIGDQDFVVRILRHGYRAAHVRQYLAAFTMTGQNMSNNQRVILERKQMALTMPWWIKVLKGPLNAARLAEKLVSGAYWQKKSFVYAVYDADDLSKRRPFCADKISFRWPTGQNVRCVE